MTKQFGVMDMFISLVVMMVLHIFTYIKTYQDLPFEVKLKKGLKELGIDVKKEDSLNDIGEKICKSR